MKIGHDTMTIYNLDKEILLLKSKVAALEELLEAHEKTVIEQSEILEQTLEKLEENIKQSARSEEVVWHQSRILQSILNSLKDGVIVTDAIGAVQLVNPAAKALLGDNLELFSLIKDIVLADKSDNSATNEDDICVRPKGSPQVVWLNILASPIKDSNDLVTGRVAVLRDITERKNASLILSKQAKALAHSNEELRQFASVVSHDLKEPLRMVSCYVKLFINRFPKSQIDDTAHEFLNYITDGVFRMQTLIQDLLTYAKVDSRKGHFVPVNCEMIFDIVLMNLKVAIEESGAIIKKERLPIVLASETHIMQLFQNLIANAMKFRGTKLLEINISAEHRSGKWIFSVRDNGIGIASGNTRRIFEIFQRLHVREEYPGTGIGLAICKKIVESYGGEIWVESIPGVGSIFYFTIPDNPD